MSNYAVANYGWSSEGQPQSCSYLAPVVLKLLGKMAPERIVDIGAGNGALCTLIKAAMPDSFLAGIEYDRQGFELARRQCPGASFFHQGIQDDPQTVLDAVTARFDVAVSTEVVEHLYAPHLLPQYAAGLLKDEGLLIVTTPYHGYLKNLLLSLANAWDTHHTPLWHGGHIKFWSRRTLSKLLHDNGFDVLDFFGVGRAPWLWKSMVIVARKRSGR